MTRVAVLDDYLHRARDLADWSALGPDAEVAFFHEPRSEDEWAAALAPFEVLILMRERTAVPRSLIERLPELRLIITTGMRNASLAIDAAVERGIVVCGTQGGGANTVETAWALIFALAKGIVREDAALRQGTWQTRFPFALRDMTLGLAGLGNLGAGMVPIAKALGMDVVAWSQNLTAERAAEVGARKVTKEELLSQSDVVSIHLVLSERSRGLFQAADLALMKPTAFLVNTSRGPIVDEAALVSALEAGTIGGAGLDVYDREPLPADHPLLRTTNTVLLPHVGYVSEAGFANWYGQAIEDITAFVAGDPIRVIAP